MYGSKELYKIATELMEGIRLGEMCKSCKE